MTPQQQLQQKYAELLRLYNGNEELASLAMDRPALAQFLSTPQANRNVSGDDLQRQFNQANAIDSGVLTQQDRRTNVPPVLSNPMLNNPPVRPNAPNYGGNVGLEMLARSQGRLMEGGNAMLAGMAEGYNVGMDKKYNADLLRYKDEMARYQSGVDKYNKALLEQKKRKEKFAQDLIPYQEQLGKLRNVKERMRIQGGGLTGIDEWADFTRIKDKFVDEPVANQRKLTRRLLNDIGVDYTLLKIAQTKGAISNKEMDLFMTPVPNMNSSEGEWELWLGKQIQAMENTIGNMERIANGQMMPIQQDFSAQIDSLLTGGVSTSSPNSSSSSSQSSNSPIKVDIVDGVVQ